MTFCFCGILPRGILSVAFCPGFQANVYNKASRQKANDMLIITFFLFKCCDNCFAVVF